MRSSIRKRIKTLTQALEALPHSELPSDSYLRANFYPFSNERGHKATIAAIKKVEPTILPKGTLRIAILIGESSFCSLLATLVNHCDLIVFADINPYLIQHTKRLLALLQLCNTRQDFEREYAILREENLYKDFKSSQITPDLDYHKKTLGQDHFLSSDEQFKAAKSAISQIRFAFSHVNLFHEDDREKFFHCFERRKCSITFFNATNIYEWDAPVALAKVHTLSDWSPRNKVNKIFAHLKRYQPMIMHSLRENASESCPLKTVISFSFEEYLERNQATAKRYLDEKFAPDKAMQSSSSTQLESMQLTLSQCSETPKLHIQHNPIILTTPSEKRDFTPGYDTYVVHKKAKHDLLTQHLGPGYVQKRQVGMKN